MAQKQYAQNVAQQQAAQTALSQQQGKQQPASKTVTMATPTVANQFHPDPKWEKYAPETMIQCDGQTPDGQTVPQKMTWREYCSTYQAQTMQKYQV